MSGNRWMKILRSVRDALEDAARKAHESGRHVGEATSPPGRDAERKSAVGMGSVNTDAPNPAPGRGATDEAPPTRTAAGSAVTARQEESRTSPAASSPSTRADDGRAGPDAEGEGGPLQYDLLSDPLLSWEDDSGRIHKGSLPELLAALSDTGQAIVSFPRLRPHQRHPWHAFLVQIAAMALRDTDAPLPTDAAQWRSLLLDLSDGIESAWRLVEDDWSQPAFLQPPFPGGKPPGKKGTEFEHPDDLDILVTSKAHDVKQHAIRQPAAEDWVYALVTVQTMGGYEGRGVYGIVRMSGGYGTRVGMALAGNLEAGARFRRDVSILRAAHDRQADQFGWNAGGLRLLWLPIWDGVTQITLSECDPWVVEVCRAMRMGSGNGRLFAIRYATQAARLADAGRQGVVGDPWVPLERTDSRKSEYRALYVSSRGFDYELVAGLLFDSDRYPPPLCGNTAGPEPGDRMLLLRALARGQGGTEGFHERIVSLPQKVRMRLGRRADRDRLRDLAAARISDVDRFRKHVLFPALHCLLRGRSGRSVGAADLTRHWVDLFKAGVDESFFDALWRDLDVEREEARRRWISHLNELGRQIVEVVSVSPPVPSARRYKVIQEAWGLYYGGLKKHFRTWWDWWVNRRTSVVSDKEETA